MAPYSCVVLDSSSAAKEAISNGLNLPKPDFKCQVNTLNNHGFMKFNFFSKTAQKFMEIAVKPGAKVLDIGAAFGEVCLESIKRGAMDYTAIDIESNHLKILARRVFEEAPEKISCVKLIEGGIPSKELDGMVEKGSYDAILVDSVLHFLTPDQIFEALQQLHSWLKPDGKIYASAATFYIAIYKSEFREKIEKMVEKFTQHVKNGSHIDPKDIPFSSDSVDMKEDPKSFVVDEHLEMFKKHILNGATRLTSFHKETIRYFFEKSGFKVEDVYWTTIDGFGYALDGKEYVGLWAKKP